MAWKGITGAAALAVLACGSAAFAADSQESAASAGSSGGASSPLLMDDATTMAAATEATTAPEAAAAPAASAPSGPTTLTPLMYALDPTSFGQWLEKYKFNVTGFVEGGWWYDTNNPHAAGSNNPDTPTYVTFPGSYSNQILLDQADITLSKGLDTTKTFDVGFLIEGGYGVDDSYTHGHGILDNRLPGNPQTQLDLLQANVSALLPVGSGLTLTAGKFVAYLGEEYINSTQNAFYTHSYSFFYGIPATNTGIMGSYTFAKAFTGHDLTVDAGITRGWNQATRDNNGSIDFLGEASANITDSLKFTFNLEVGPQAPKDNHDYWTTPELILSDTVSDQETVSADIVYSDAPNAVASGAAQWYGVALYSAYKISSMVTFNLRGEWFRDQGGFETGNQANYYEVTAGLQVHPLPDSNVFQWLQVRPEVRYDLSDRRVFDAVGDNGQGNHGQLSAGLDVIMQF